MIDFTDAIYKLYPQAVRTINDIAYDADGNEVEYDKAAVEAKVIEMQAEAEAAKQAQINARQAALNKLMALGLTEEEALALGK
jgi:hypothetical protein